MPGILGESEGSAADFAGKAFISPLGSAINGMKKALVLRVCYSMGLAWGSRTGGGHCLSPPGTTQIFSQL